MRGHQYGFITPALSGCLCYMARGYIAHTVSKDIWVQPFYGGLFAQNVYLFVTIAKKNLDHKCPIAERSSDIAKRGTYYETERWYLTTKQGKRRQTRSRIEKRQTWN